MIREFEIREAPDSSAVLLAKKTGMAKSATPVSFYSLIPDPYSLPYCGFDVGLV